MAEQLAQQAGKTASTREKKDYYELPVGNTLLAPHLCHPRRGAGGGEQMKIIAALIAATISVFMLGIGIAEADCQTDCYDSGNTGYHCVTNCS